MTASGEGQMDAPAPWQLRGEGIVLVRRDLGVVMFVDYAHSPVGPYRELLFIPARLQPIGERRRLSIAKIYVSTQASVDNGRRNWGIPKELASFEVVRASDRSERVTVAVNGRHALTLTVRHAALSLPLSTRMLPARFRTLGQLLDGKTFEVTPRGRGRVHPARVLEVSSDGALFPALTKRDVLLAMRLSQVKLTFPEARVGEKRTA